MKMADGLTEQEKRDLRFVFDVYDPKQTGLISADDVVRAMTALAFSQSRDVIEVFDIHIVMFPLPQHLNIATKSNRHESSLFCSNSITQKADWLQECTYL